MTVDTLNFLEGEGISVQTGPNPADPAVLDIEIGNTIGGLLDAKGDLVAGSGLDTAARLPVGTDGQVLTAASSAETGLVWAVAAGGGTSFYEQTSAPVGAPLGAVWVDTDG